MDVTPFIDSLRQDLARSAEVGGEDVRAAAERLIGALEPAVRLTLMEVLAQAAAEISAELPNLAVEVRLKGREPVFAVLGDAAPSREPTERVEGKADEDEGVARVTFRLPEALKAKAETLAARRGQSLNAWLVAAARAAASGEDQPNGQGNLGRHGSRKRVQGWAR